MVQRRLKMTANDEVERRGVALPTNETDLSRSSTLSLAHRRFYPRVRSNRLLEVVRITAHHLR